MKREWHAIMSFEPKLHNIGLSSRTFLRNTKSKCFSTTNQTFIIHNQKRKVLKTPGRHIRLYWVPDRNDVGRKEEAWRRWMLITLYSNYSVRPLVSK